LERWKGWQSPSGGRKSFFMVEHTKQWHRRFAVPLIRGGGNLTAERRGNVCS
jgi:hypothetical protein